MSLHDSIPLPSGLRLPNRLCKAAMAEDLSPETHVPTEAMNTAYRNWADGGWGLILTGNVQVSQDYLGSPGDLWVPSPAERGDPAIMSAWTKFAEAVQVGGGGIKTPAIVQLCHPGRQSPGGVGRASFFGKRVAPSPVPLNLGSALIARAAAALLFGTPRALTLEEIRGPEGVIAQFVAGAVHCERAGFSGVELHAAHGYLLAQFMSPMTNKRTDEYGGSAAARVKVVVEIIRAIRAATGKGFAVGIKLNSVDASQAESAEDIIEQVRLISEAGVDFVEISGGTYENPRMLPSETDPLEGEKHAVPSSTVGVKPSTAKREAFFLEFTQTLRQHFPDMLLMVTGGFRTRAGMQDAVKSGACDMVGLGRPAAAYPRLPKEIILNEELPQDAAHVKLDPLKVPWLVRMLPISAVGGGYQSYYYATKIKAMANVKA